MLFENELDAKIEEEDELPEKTIIRRTLFSGRQKKALNDALTRFTSCGRCSLFLAAYSLNHDDAELRTAVDNVNDGWLTLPWDPTIRELIHKSYGCRVDVESYHFESWCPECHGSFVYAETDDGESHTLQVKM